MVLPSVISYCALIIPQIISGFSFVLGSDGRVLIDQYSPSSAETLAASQRGLFPEALVAGEQVEQGRVGHSQEEH